MPLLYLAKVNLNSQIFDVYNKKLSINEVNKQIYEKISNDTNYSDNDVFKELITFCERQSFGYNQFSRAIAKMLNKCLPEYDFEIFLQKDKNLLDEKFNWHK